MAIVWGVEAIQSKITDLPVILSFLACVLYTPDRKCLTFLFFLFFWSPERNTRMNRFVWASRVMIPRIHILPRIFSVDTYPRDARESYWLKDSVTTSTQLLYCEYLYYLRTMPRMYVTIRFRCFTASSCCTVSGWIIQTSVQAVAFFRGSYKYSQVDCFPEISSDR